MDGACHSGICLNQELNQRPQDAWDNAQPNHTGQCSSKDLNVTVQEATGLFKEEVLDGTPTHVFQEQPNQNQIKTSSMMFGATESKNQFAY